MGARGPLSDQSRNSPVRLREVSMHTTAQQIARSTAVAFGFIVGRRPWWPAQHSRKYAYSQGLTETG